MTLLNYVSAETATEESVRAAMDEALAIAKSNFVRPDVPPSPHARVPIGGYDWCVREGMTAREVADEFGVSYKAAYEGLKRAKARAGVA